MTKIKIYDILFQCPFCGRDTEHLLSAERWQVGDTTLAICSKCSDDDDVAIITHVAPDVIIDDPEQIREHLEETSANKEFVAHLIRDRVPDEIESITAWVIPQSRYPKRGWLTIREAAKIIGLPRETLATWIKRGKFFSYQVKGLIQNAGGSVLLLHRSVVEEIKRKNSEERGLT